MLRNPTFEQAANDLLLFGIELRNGFEPQAEFIIETALSLPKRQLV
jgi:hypothetical protein